jgi:hypothetical protein
LLSDTFPFTCVHSLWAKSSWWAGNCTEPILSLPNRQRGTDTLTTIIYYYSVCELMVFAVNVLK